MTFDGLTYAVYLDGVEVHSAMGEGRQFPNLPGVPLTIGDLEVDPEDPNRLVAPFRGTVDEVWIATDEFIPELDAFRADNYFGDAVSSGKREKRAEDELVLALGRPGNGAAVEAGEVEVFGSVSKRAELAATIDGETVFSQRVDAGTFTVQVPVMKTGAEIEVVFTATSTAEGGPVSEPVTLTLDVTDTIAPAVPITSAEKPANAPLELQVTPRTELPERVRAQFYANESVALGAGNVVVRTGSTEDRVPDALTPTSGTVTTETSPTTVGEDRNPYQIYRIALTEEQAAENEWHFSWRGTADARTVSAWVWNTETAKWALKEANADPEGRTVNLDVRATDADRAVDGSRTLTVLIWRGLTEEPWAQGSTSTGASRRPTTTTGPSTTWATPSSTRRPPRGR
ncbi:hypothetical protein [Leucobacter soli]|uniref:hypothetical protein n=1 Tax=Leucobacter soli TaxID=2812850 RepID=UPI00360F84DB